MPARIAVIGGGISGAALFHSLEEYFGDSNDAGATVQCDLYDQGRAVGGRTSTRFVNDKDTNVVYKFDHGCQFFRADTPTMKAWTRKLYQRGYVNKWDGPHHGSTSADFFGLPNNKEPIYISNKGGMHSIARDLINEASSSSSNFCVYPTVRVAKIDRDETTNKWKLYGVGQRAALHDTPEEEAQEAQFESLHAGRHEGYDYIILTDISQCFETWHRASAGVPLRFAKDARSIAGARVPLFTAMVTFSASLGLDASSISYNRDDDDSESFNGGGIVWFAACNNTKIAFPVNSSSQHECWTLVSTPEYAIAKITETPMQDATTGAFIPQTSEYLLSVPAPDLIKAFLKSVDKEDRYDQVIHMDAQRWGSALPSDRSVASDESSPTRTMIAGVPYEGGRYSLAPTKKYREKAEEGSDSISRKSIGKISGNTDESGSAEMNKCSDTDEYDDFMKSFIVDEDTGMYMASDMISRYTPGFESAVLSALECGNHLKMFHSFKSTLEDFATMHS